MKQFVENMSDGYFIQEELEETLKHLKLLAEKSRVWNPLVPQVHLLELESQPQQHVVSHPISQFIIFSWNNIFEEDDLWMLQEEEAAEVEEKETMYIVA